MRAPKLNEKSRFFRALLTQAPSATKIRSFHRDTISICGSHPSAQWPPLGCGFGRRLSPRAMAIPQLNSNIQSAHDDGPIPKLYLRRTFYFTGKASICRPKSTHQIPPQVDHKYSLASPPWTGHRIALAIGIGPRQGRQSAFTTQFPYRPTVEEGSRTPRQALESPDRRHRSQHFSSTPKYPSPGRRTHAIRSAYGGGGAGCSHFLETGGSIGEIAWI